MPSFGAALPAALVQQLPPDGVEVTCKDDADRLQSQTGAYLLLLYLKQPVVFTRRAIGSASLGGWLVYAGSANGPGGIRARLQHHFRRDKRIHWHVDELTLAASSITAFAYPGRTECALVRHLLDCGLFKPPLAGFGSSDCRICPSHLLCPVQSAGLTL